MEKKQKTEDEDENAEQRRIYLDMKRKRELDGLQNLPQVS